MIAEDRQSQEDCHTLQNRSRRIPGSARKGCIANGHGLPTRTLRSDVTAHSNTLGPRRIFRSKEVSYCFIFLLIYQIKRVLRHPESNPKDSGNEVRRLLDKPLAYPPDPLDGRVPTGY